MSLSCDENLVQLRLPMEHEPLPLLAGSMEESVTLELHDRPSHSFSTVSIVRLI